MNRSGSEVQALPMYSDGVRPPRVLSRRAKLEAAKKVREVCEELVVAVVVEALDGGLLDCPVHLLDLAVGPRVVGLRGATVCNPQSSAPAPVALTAQIGKTQTRGLPHAG